MITEDTLQKYTQVLSISTYQYRAKVGLNLKDLGHLWLAYKEIMYLGCSIRGPTILLVGIHSICLRCAFCLGNFAWELSQILLMLRQ